MSLKIQKTQKIQMSLKFLRIQRFLKNQRFLKFQLNRLLLDFPEGLYSMC